MYGPYVACGPPVYKLCFGHLFSNFYYENFKCVDKLK